MPRFTVSNLSPDTPLDSQTRLKDALMKLSGVRTVVITLGRKEFAITCTGMEPNIHILREACSSVGFNLARRV